MASVGELREREHALVAALEEHRRELGETEQEVRELEQRRELLRGQLERAQRLARAAERRRGGKRALWVSGVIGVFLVPALAFWGMLSGICASAFVIIPLSAVLGEAGLYPMPVLMVGFALVGVWRAVLLARNKPR